MAHKISSEKKFDYNRIIMVCKIKIIIERFSLGRMYRPLISHYSIFLLSSCCCLIMTSSVNLSKRSQNSSSGAASEFNGIYALLRGQATGKLHIVLHKEIISAKKLTKLDVRDISSYEKRDKRIRTTIVLLGKTLIIINK